MIDPKRIQELSQQFIDSLPPTFKTLHSELDKNFKTVMSSAFTQLNIVSREEFDAQATLLAQNKNKLEMLQKEVEALSQKIARLEILE